MEETIELKKENVLAAYKTAREAGADNTCKVLEELFGKDTFKPEDVTDRIKTFKDACEWCLTHDKRHLVAAYQSMCGNGGTVGCEDVEAYLKLRIICAALNEGWEPQFTENEIRCFPWFYKNFEEMDEEDRNRVVGRAGYNVYYAASSTSTFVGSRLAFKSNELAAYCGKQFIDIWGNFIC